MKLDVVKKLSINNKKSLEQIGLKLAEETGEVSQALLSYLKADGSVYKDLGAEDVKEECVDTILVALSLFYKLGGETSQLSILMGEKIKKWEQNS